MIKRIIDFILKLLGYDLKKDDDKFRENKTEIFYMKKKIMSASEVNFYNLLREIVGDKYIIWPQINLASVIEKNLNSKYSKNYRKFQTELFRNIDFGIFDKNTLDLLLLIELNDNSHYNTSRKNRDYKVKEICNKCNYNLITFWLNKPNEYVHL